MSTFRRAYTIVKRNQVRLNSITKNVVNFKVKTRSDEWVDVWIKITGDDVLWECNAKGKNYGCVMRKITKRPFCSHEKAVYLWLIKRKIILRKENIKSTKQLLNVLFSNSEIKE